MAIDILKAIVVIVLPRTVWKSRLYLHRWATADGLWKWEPRRTKAQTLYRRLTVCQRRIKRLGRIFKFNLEFFRQIEFNLYVAESFNLFDCMVSIELNSKIARRFKLGLTCLAAISGKSCNTSARVIVFTIYTRPTVQTFVINTVVDVCQKHRSTMYNVDGHLNLLVNFLKYEPSNFFSTSKPNFASKRHTCLAETPSVPLWAVTRECVDPIHTRTTVLTSVTDTVINVCTVKQTKSIFWQNWAANRSDT